ncbi:MAG: threonine aldolase family protein [Myxococcales bacterium]
MDLIDLRSDTVTRPTPGMRKAMAAAEVGDDVYGEDPSVNALEERIASLLGKEAAVWVPTGTMANQIALGSLAGMGEEIICDRHCHVVNYEGGAISALWGAQSLVVDGARGIFTPEAVKAVLRGSQGDHDPRQKAVAVENTHNRGGGSIWPLAQLEAVAEVAHAAGLLVHLDGARIWNAHVATGIAIAKWCERADTVSVCLSKGLGAPAGSLVATTRERMKTVRRLRKRLGGGLRQAGVLAAAGMYALDNHLQRLGEDHESARRLSARVPLAWHAPETNILLADVPNAPALVSAAKAEGVLINAVNATRIRAVTHLDFPLGEVEEAAGRLRRASGRL